MFNKRMIGNIDAELGSHALISSKLSLLTLSVS